MSMNQCNGLEGSGMVYAIRKGSRQDGPGTRTVVLFKGCSFSCWWCPNPEIQSFSPALKIEEVRCVRCGTCVTICPVEAAREDGVSGSDPHYTVEREVCITCGSCVSQCAGQAREVIGQCLSADAVMAQIAPDAALLRQSGGGVTFAGGEPLMQADFLVQLLGDCKALGLHTAVDTSGYTPWVFLERIRGSVDLFLFDLKMIDEERHRQFTGLPNSLILANLRRLSELGHRIILRVPLIPGITDDDGNLRSIAAFAASLPRLESVELVPYRQSGKEAYAPAGFASPAGVEQAAQVFRGAGLQVSAAGAKEAV